MRLALVVMPLTIGAGCGVIWTKSTMAGTPAIELPVVARLSGQILKREEQPAQGRVRLLVATREPGTGRAIKVRLNLAAEDDRPDLVEGADLRVRARLIPPAPPMLPGGYDFARAAWFGGIAASGKVPGEIEVTGKGQARGPLQALQRALSRHVREELPGSAGAIAAAFASEDQGGIAKADEDAMRYAGLTHLLSISGLHVSAVIAVAYFLAVRLLGLWPWLALRTRLPLVAAAAGALAGTGYTLLTGAEVPTIRSCIGALLVLAALALGREPLSMRMIAVGAFIILLVWPEALAGPSFQMSFAAVIAIVAVHEAAPTRRFLAVREEAWWARGLRHLAMLLLTGAVVELALMPIGLFHFHRAGIYGAFANVIAIPLTTFASMPLIALALLGDAVGVGVPFWWLAGKSLDMLLALAHWAATRPGAVTSLPASGLGPVLLCTAGGIWLALWRGHVRLWGLALALAGLALLLAQLPPDVLVSGDGHHVGIVGETGADLLVLRESRSDYTRENLLEIAGMDGQLRALDTWPGAVCNPDFRALRLDRGGRSWQLLIGRGKDMVAERALAAACEHADIAISDRWLPASCQPRWLKVDRTRLERSGGLAIDLEEPGMTTVADQEGAHGWWQANERPPSIRKNDKKPGAAPRSRDVAGVFRSEVTLAADQRCRGSVISAQQACQLALDDHVARVVDLWRVGRICRIETDLPILSTKVLERRFFPAHQSDDDFAIAGAVGAADQRVVPVKNAGLDHRIA